MLRRRATVLLLFTLTALVPVAARAQDDATNRPPRPARWTAELFGGGLTQSRASGGAPIPAFPAGDPFVTDAGTTSRGHASWRFGDGAALFNEVAARFAQIEERPFVMITPLDSVLRGSASSGGLRRTVGLRVGRDLTPTVSFDVIVERSPGDLTPSDEMLAAITAADESFVAAFEDLLGTAPVTGLQVVSAVTPPSNVHSQMRVMGAINTVLARGARWHVAGTLGGGVQLRGGTAAQVVLNGRYEFSLFSSAAFFERDEVVITFEEPASAALGLLGLSATVDLAPGTGLRLGVRANLTANRATTTIQTKPFINTAQTPSTLPTLTTPALQFSNQTTPSSSLQPSLASTRTTFTGSGLNRQIVFTVGLVRRF